MAFSAAVTLLYTPLFKKLTAIKNATVATVIALAPLAGALAAGAVSVSGAWVLVLDLCTFLVVRRTAVQGAAWHSIALNRTALRRTTLYRKPTAHVHCGFLVLVTRV